ncbi:MAG: FAD-dependent oxidoreductase [Oscillospiraceae bacterium]|nr:FAD-dependent oxidoreductase [Oscillospiraceae bacterium]
MQMISKKMFCDVAIIGGGVAGVSAAITTTRRGLRTIIFEKGASLGGLATNGYVPQVAGMIEGNCKELVERLEADGELIRRSPTDDHNPTFDPEYAKFMCEQMVMERTNGRIIYDATCIDVEMDGNNIKSAVFFTKGGWMAVYARMFIDATGDGDVAAMAGVPYEVGGADFAGLNMSTTLGSRWSRANLVKYRAANEAFQKEQADKGVPQEKRVTLLYSEEEKALEQGIIAHHIPFFQVIIPHYSDECADFVTYSFHSYYTKNDDVENISRQIIEQHQQMRAYEKFLQKQVPGYEDVNIVGLGSIPGVRDGRRPFGEYMLKAADVMCGTKFEDGIARFPEVMDTHHPTSPKHFFMRHGHLQAPAGSAITREAECDMDMHPFVQPSGIEARPDPRDYCDIPYRSLVPLVVDNLFVVGRCCSAEFHANGAMRIIAPAMGTGQAAGVATDYAIKKNLVPRDIDGRDIRKAMIEEEGVELDKLPDGYWADLRARDGDPVYPPFGDMVFLMPKK